MNWSRLLTSALCFIVLVLFSPHADAQPNPSSDSALQRWCADQAKNVLKQLNLETKQDVHYLSHYNRSDNKCFVAIDTHRGKIITKALLDAYAMRTYASYFSMADAPLLRQCILMPDAREKKKCKSVSDYESFVAGYMRQ